MYVIFSNLIDRLSLHESYHCNVFGMPVDGLCLSLCDVSHINYNVDIPWLFHGCFKLIFFLLDLQLQ